jgi:glycerophosphoryl diester phosphodiesterase
MSAVPIVIAHRGASGYAPEHTLASYFLAMQMGADFIEPDLVMTRDGVLIARHENEIGGTTDVAGHPEFAGRRTRRLVDGVSVEGWFSEDFTLAELKMLRVRERIPQLRPANSRFDGRFEIATLEEILVLVQGVDAQRAARARQLSRAPPPAIGLYPETKHPSYFAARGLAMEAVLVATLARHGYAGRTAPVWLQSFEVGNLRALSGLTELRRVQLLEAAGAPYDYVAGGDPRTYADLTSSSGLEQVAAYAQAIGPHKSLVIPRRADDTLAAPTPLVADAHAQGLEVHPWTFRAENAFLPAEFRRGEEAEEQGELAAELRAYLACGIDGFFTDQPDLGVAERDAFLRHAGTQASARPPASGDSPSA